LTSFIKRALRRMVNARTGGGLSLLKGRAFSTPAAPKKLRASGARRFDAGRKWKTRELRVNKFCLDFFASGFRLVLL
jgi:hypothetical protein